VVVSTEVRGPNPGKCTSVGTKMLSKFEPARRASRAIIKWKPPINVEKELRCKILFWLCAPFAPTLVGGFHLMISVALLTHSVLITNFFPQHGQNHHLHRSGAPNLCLFLRLSRHIAKGDRSRARQIKIRPRSLESSADPSGVTGAQHLFFSPRSLPHRIRPGRVS